jgi:hypothetical protein
VRTSEDKVRKKDLCWYVRAVYVLKKRPDVSGPGLEAAGRYKNPSYLVLKLLVKILLRKIQYVALIVWYEKQFL